MHRCIRTAAVLRALVRRVGRARPMSGHGPCRQRRGTGSAAAVSRRQLVEHRHLERAPIDANSANFIASSTTAARASCIPTSAARRRRAASRSTACRTRSWTEPAEARGHVRLLGRKRRRQLRDRTGHTVLSDPCAGDDAAALGRRRRARQRRPARGQRPASPDHRLHATGTSTSSTTSGTTPHEVVRGLRRILRHEHQQPAARHVDLRGRGGARDLSRPRALRRGLESRDHRHRPRVPRHGARHQRLRLSGIAPRGQHRGRVADGRAAAPQEQP